MPVSQREGFHVSFAPLAGVHGGSWPSASTRSPAAPWDPPPSHPRLTPSDQRQGLCLRFGLPSAWAARLPAPAGLTQAKGVPGLVGRGGPIGPTLPLRSLACH